MPGSRRAAAKLGKVAPAAPAKDCGPSAVRSDYRMNRKAPARQEDQNQYHSRIKFDFLSSSISGALAPCG